jgi:hypothetical protein
MVTRTGADVGGPHRGWAARDEHWRGRVWDQVGGVAGLVFVVLVIATFFTPGTPTSGESPDNLAAALSDDLTGHQWSLLLGFLSNVAFLVLLAGLWSRMRRWEGPGGLFSGLFGVAGTAFVTLLLVSEGIYLALVAAPEVGTDRLALPALAVLDNWVGAAIIPAVAAMFLGATGAVLSTRTFPVWLGWLAALIAVLFLVSIAAVFDMSEDENSFLGIIGFAGFVLTLVWILAASILLVMRAGRTPERAL